MKSDNTELQYNYYAWVELNLGGNYDISFQEISEKLGIPQLEGNYSDTWQSCSFCTQKYSGTRTLVDANDPSNFLDGWVPYAIPEMQMYTLLTNLVAYLFANQDVWQWLRKHGMTQPHIAVVVNSSDNIDFEFKSDLLLQMGQLGISFSLDTYSSEDKVWEFGPGRYKLETMPDQPLVPGINNTIKLYESNL